MIGNKKQATGNRHSRILSRIGSSLLLTAFSLNTLPVRFPAFAGISPASMIQSVVDEPRVGHTRGLHDGDNKILSSSRKRRAVSAPRLQQVDVSTPQRRRASLIVQSNDAIPALSRKGEYLANIWLLRSHNGLERLGDEWHADRGMKKDEKT